MCIGAAVCGGNGRAWEGQGGVVCSKVLGLQGWGALKGGGSMGLLVCWPGWCERMSEMYCVNVASTQHQNLMRKD